MRKFRLKRDIVPGHIPWLTATSETLRKGLELHEYAAATSGNKGRVYVAMAPNTKPFFELPLDALEEVGAHEKLLAEAVKAAAWIKTVQTASAIPDKENTLRNLKAAIEDSENEFAAANFRREDFSFNCDQSGYMIKYKHKCIGGAGILGTEYPGKGQDAQAEEKRETYRKMAEAEIDSILSGRIGRFRTLIDGIDRGLLEFEAPEQVTGPGR